MNILWISHFVPYPPKAGMLTRSYNLLRESSKYHDIYLVAFIQRKPLSTMFVNADEGLIEAEQHLSGLCKQVEFQEIPSECTRLGKYLVAIKSLLSTSSYSVDWLHSDTMQRTIDSILDQVDIHVIHADTISLAPYVENKKEQTMLLTHHNIESHMMLKRAEGTSNWIKKLIYNIEGRKIEKYERKVCPLFSVNITCSQLDSERLSNVCHGLNIKEIPNGVDTNYFQPQQLDTEPYSLIFAGGLNWYPNLSAMKFFLHEVWPLLKEKRENIVIDIVGQDPPQEFLDLSESDPSLRIHGFVDDVRPYISRAAVYVCPISYSGGTKLKVLML
jgi:glycosyltransferase involved in cell wall biosynthesis